MSSSVNIRVLSVALASVAMVTAIALAGVGGTKAGARQQRPARDWRFSAHPYIGAGYESRPVVVSSVKTELKDFTVTAARVRNISSKPVLALKLGWFLYGKGKTRVLRRGVTPLIAISGGLPTGESKILTYPILSFGKISTSLAEKGELQGDLRLEVAVAEILFADESTWAADSKAVVSRQEDGTLLVRTSYRRGAAPLRVNPTAPGRGLSETGVPVRPRPSALLPLRGQ